MTNPSPNLPVPNPDSNLEQHAFSELNRAKLFSEEGDFYDGMLGRAVFDLIVLFAKQGHSGMSGSITIDLFQKLANFQALSPLTNDPAEWQLVSDPDPDPRARRPNHPSNGVWQSRRTSSAFSNDGGKTYYLLENRNTLLYSQPQTQTDH